MIRKISFPKIFLRVALLSSFACAQHSYAQQSPVNSPLLDHLVGHWVLKGIVAGQQTTHDVDAEWELDHHYLRVHEVSRDKDNQGKPKYEALVFIAWNDEPKQYACAWLDVFGGLAAESIGVATPKENEIPFVFKNEKGVISLTNDFLYHPSSGTWDWSIDNVDKDAATPFARVQLTRTER
jgi:hypothetical protein